MTNDGFGRWSVPSARDLADVFNMIMASSQSDQPARKQLERPWFGQKSPRGSEREPEMKAIQSQRLRVEL